MEELLKLIPNSIVSLIGLAVLLGLLIMLGTIFQEWAKSIWRRSVISKEKRSPFSSQNYQGIEKRSDHRALEGALIQVLESLDANTKELRDFVSTYKAAHGEIFDSIEEIKRKQDKNWKRLFDEELPAARPQA